jgi:SAM-dependent methyltransferase
MSQMTDKTIAYYDANVEKYINESVSADMELLYADFLASVPVRGSLLDLGCGAGRDTKAFLERDYKVTAIDGSQQMVDATTRLTGQPAIHMRFQEIAFENEFDGIWACASLLHVSREEFANVLYRIEIALHPQGICYMSLKEGHGERVDGDRQFTYFTADELRVCLEHETRLDVYRIWSSDDPRPGRSERWVNVLTKGKKGERSVSSV